MLRAVWGRRVLGTKNMKGGKARNSVHKNETKEPLTPRKLDVVLGKCWPKIAVFTLFQIQDCCAPGILGKIGEFSCSGKVMEKSGNFATNPGKMTFFVAKSQVNLT